MKRLAATTIGVLMLFGAASLALAAEKQGTSGAGASTMSDSQIKQKLESEGYSNVQIKEHDKGHVDVTASKNGKTEKLAVNPQTGRAMPDTDKD